MVRVMVGLAAWAAGTAIALSVAWLGANVVVRNAGVDSGLPLINAAVLPASASPSPAVTPPVVVPPSAASPSPTHSPAGRRAASPASASPGGAGPSPSASASASASASPSAGTVHAYAMTGGRVTLNVTGDSVQLVTAVPDAGYSVQTWSGTDWLRVDFSSGPQVSSLIASWYLHAPTITVTN
jgi:hypothetical protein